MQTIKVAIVEDRPDLRKSLTTLLKECSELSFVGAYATAKEALELIPEIKPDVVLMDLHLAGLNGIECTRQLKEMYPKLQVLMLTVEENDDDLVFSALGAGASGYLVKRHSMDKVLESIKAICRGEVPISPSIARKILITFRELPEAVKGLEKLTESEKKILSMIAQGFRNKEIAETLDVKVTTIESHLRNIYQKLSVKSRTQAALKFKGLFWRAKDK